MQMPNKISFAPPPASASVPQLYLAAGTLFLLALLSGGLAISYLICPMDTVPWLTPLTPLTPLCDDGHYKYLVPLLLPVTAWFVIANWVGWEYFRYA
ncbi:hypothetical protein EHS25_009510 [Saitozyma podzolica]|uniref:Uncharacterized protein n=1 Tax=Saitozyma podzolica TaxID=1890683 RepID=A0A427YJF6_9TREE|nr:hypothetical protein EHS25_009510 [Saitozyma podzolica]